MIHKVMSAEMTLSAIFMALIIHHQAMRVRGVTCTVSDWTTTFDNAGLSKCKDLNNAYISGFSRSSLGTPDTIDRLEGANCCQIDPVYQTTAYVVKYSDWSWTMTQNNRWSWCPQGFFLSGLSRSAGNQAKVNSIQQARCVKPSLHPYYYRSCYDESIEATFEAKGSVSCRDGYYVVGLYRGNCDELKCIDSLHCCQMALRPEELDSLAAVKNRIMDQTLQSLSYLAYYLGYAWCNGCRSPFIGEDFVKSGDTWLADTTGVCSGTRANERLKIKYDDWSFGVTSLIYDQQLVLAEVVAEVIDSGTFSNNGPDTSSMTITRAVEVARTIRHTKTSSWKVAAELGIELNYIFESTNIKFTYENSEVSETGDETENNNKFQVETTKELPAYSACDWKLILTKTKSSNGYKALVSTKFSVEFQGFLRYRDSYYGPDTNYHYDYRGKDTRPAFNYRFGKSGIPFYSALKRESSQNMYPWMWNDIVTTHGQAQEFIDYLNDESTYTIPLTGKFEDISGKNVFFQWNCPSNQTYQRVRRSAGDGERQRTESPNGMVKHIDKRNIKLKA
ncbi:unnamed protein product [Lymnaea stagnalis]|uniref:Aerolysin-like C-terminal domain-containing protein n=1 Tax=Lymnaea stagnalis TaxID=6523 RepID=A0AAV2HUQ3_LYMST